MDVRELELLKPASLLKTGEQLYYFLKKVRHLAPLNHLQNLKSSIPETVTFMEMYGAETFEDLGVVSRWEKHAPYKSLAVPLGLRGKEDIVYLNLHEKAHGPHGLVAGTTGSGKSEVIQSYILSLAVNFHPHDVAFLLIDYKGGGMANLFKDLPHLLGTITNLDGAQSMRALVSINAELKRRQRLFATHDVNHINQYQKKYKLGEVSEPMPHLFLISDEFAELKTNQPDFMKELVSTARIGRSLGIHLILATQKPSGVVDDQIWSNSRFKLALKVADRSDSMEMLKTPDAAEITQVGRGYLQVGNNEVYELFQSAWSGADYQPDKDEQGIEDHTIYAINDIGQYEILNEDLSGLDQAESIKEVPSELQAIVSKLKALTERLSIKALPQPWLPPLSKEIFLQDLRPQGFKDLWGQASGLVARLGMVDIPSRQSQEVLEHDFEKDGHIALFSSPGMGKSTFVQTVLVDLFRQNNPDRLHTYLLDFGTNGLLALNDYPHVAEYFLVEETEKLQKLIKRLQDEIRERRKLFTDSSVHNIEMYRKLGDRKLADIVIAVDSYDGLKGSEVEVAIDTLLQTLARDGMGLGIYLILTASRTGALKNNLYSNFKRRIALKMNDDSEARAIVGRTALVIEDVPGRGLIQVDDPELIQLAMPAKGENGLEMLEALRHESQEMAKNWDGALPQGIVIVPEVLDEQTFLQMVETEKAIASDFIPIGLEFEEVHTISLPIHKLKHLLILTEKEQHKLVAVRHLLNMLWHVRKGQSVTLFDVTDEYGRFAGKVGQYYSSSELTENVVEELKMRVLHARKQKEQMNEFVIISDLPAFMTVDGMSDNDFALLYEEGQRVGLHLIVVANKTYMSLSSGIQRLIKQKLDTVLIAMKMSNQSVVARSEVGREAELAIDEVYLHYQDQQIKLKITKEIE